MPVRCRYLNSTGFLSRTSDFPHSLPFPLHEKRANKVCQNRTSSVDVTMPVHCFPFLLQHLHNNWSPLGRAVFPCAPTAGQRTKLFFCLLRKDFFYFIFLVVTWCCWLKAYENHTACLQLKTQLLVHLQNQLDQALTSSFLTCVLAELKWEQENATERFWFRSKT